MEYGMDPLMENIIFAAQQMQRMQSRVYVMDETGRLVEVEQHDIRDVLSAPPDPIIPIRRLKEYGTHFRGDLCIEKPEYDECVIMQDKIGDGDLYHKCSECSHCVSVEAMQSWWSECKRREKQTTCPHCRSEWSNNKIYCNSN